MRTRISATRAAREFSDLLNRVQYRKETFEVERRGRIICEIRPADTKKFTGTDFLALVKSAPKPDAEYFEAVEGFVRAQPKAEKSRWPR